MDAQVLARSLGFPTIRNSAFFWARWLLRKLPFVLSTSISQQVRRPPFLSWALRRDGIFDRIRFDAPLISEGLNILRPSASDTGRGLQFL